MRGQGGNPGSSLREEVADRAGYWDARLRSPDCTDEDRIRFAAWRDATPENRAAFERLQLFVTALRHGSGRAEVRGLREAASSATGSRRVHGLKALAAGVALLATALGIWAFASGGALKDASSRLLAALQGADLYATDFGQRSTVTLEDGSSVELNARTRMEVKFDRQRRSIRLLGGQALFNVAKDPRRPFVVRAGNRDIMAVGTAFDVRLDSQSVRVTLLEGKVNVDRSDAAEARTHSLEPGQQFVAMLREGRHRKMASAADAGAVPAVAAASPAEQTQVRPVDVEKVTSWRDGRVFLEDLSLADAVAEMNRYSRVQVAIGDVALARLRVNGMFRAGEQVAFVAALQEYFPVVARRDGATEITLFAR